MSYNQDLGQDFSWRGLQDKKKKFSEIALVDSAPNGTAQLFSQDVSLRE